MPNQIPNRDPARVVTTTEDMASALENDGTLRRELYRELAKELIAGLPRCLWCGRIMIGARKGRKFCNDSSCGAGYRRKGGPRRTQVAYERVPRISPTK